jgi:hypothetical protein
MAHRCLNVSLHCKLDPIYVFPEIKLRGLILNFHIHVSLSDLFIPKCRSIYLGKRGCISLYIVLEVCNIRITGAPPS